MARHKADTGTRGGRNVSPFGRSRGGEGLGYFNTHVRTPETNRRFHLHMLGDRPGLTGRSVLIFQALRVISCYIVQVVMVLTQAERCISPERII